MPATAEHPYHRHRLSVDDDERMGQANILGEDDRVGLIEGEIIDMPPFGSIAIRALRATPVSAEPGISRQSVLSACQTPCWISADSSSEMRLAWIM